MFGVILFVVLLGCCLTGVSGHGRLTEPPSRSNMWRHGFKTQKNYNDMGLNCGGFPVQFERNHGRCGVCGDPWHEPRDNEAGGKYARGVIVRQYKPNSIIDLAVDITSNHMGWFEFRLCPVNNPMVKATQACLDRHLLHIIGYGTRYTIRDKSKSYKINLKVMLPPNLTCKQCVMQWKWVAAQSMGPDGYGGECLGCGNQEHFINCADIAIGNEIVKPLAPYKGTPLTNVKPSAGSDYVAKTVQSPQNMNTYPSSQGNMVPNVAQTYHQLPPQPLPQVYHTQTPGPVYRTQTPAPVYHQQPSVQQVVQKPAPVQAYHPPSPQASPHVYRPQQEVSHGYQQQHHYMHNEPVQSWQNSIPTYLTPTQAPPRHNHVQNYATPAPSYNSVKSWSEGHNSGSWQNERNAVMEMQRMFPGFMENWEWGAGTEPATSAHEALEPGEYAESEPSGSSSRSGSHHTPSRSGGHEGQYQRGYSDALQQLSRQLGIPMHLLKDATGGSQGIASEMAESSKTPSASAKPCAGGITPTCKGINSWQGQPKFDRWCSEVCPKGNCPTTTCSCTCPGEMPVQGRRYCWGLKDRNMDTWCTTNCDLGNCPSDLCACGAK